MSVIVMEPLLGGKLANLPKDAAAFLQKAKPGSSPVEWALRYVWDEPGVTVILSGMNKQAQLDENIATVESALPGSLSDAERSLIAEVKAEFNKNYKVPCTGCNYCIPCPQKINIPGCFEAYNTSYALGRFTGVIQYMTSLGGITRDPHFASNCVKCGACVKKCPQQINIPEELTNVGKRLHLPGIRGIIKFVGKRMSKA
jgi:predicted aldo/keto reductase-like oxidoreductase